MVLVPGVMAALALAVDGRHRDFLTLAFLLPAAALILHDRRDRPANPAEAWLAGALLVCGPFAIDALVNREALVWALCCLALAWASRRQILAELRRLYAALRQNQRGDDHRHA